jgi:hypothetical protein
MNDLKKTPSSKTTGHLRDEDDHEMGVEVLSVDAAPVTRGFREAALRAEELRNRMRDQSGFETGDMYDEFYINPSVIPDGWDYNWKLKSVYGMEDKDHVREMYKVGWEPVPSKRHPEMMPIGYNGAIERKGMMLMERPSEISDMAKDRELSMARQAVSDKEQAIGIARGSAYEQGRKTVGKSYGPMAVPRS